MRTNVKPSLPPAFTHQGGLAKNIRPEAAMRRCLLSCLLWEREFYEDGQSIADRLRDLSTKVSAKFLADLAVEARSKFHLRHAPLYVLCLLAEKKEPGHLRNAVYETIQRPDEMGELIALWWKDGKRPLPNGMKRGIADAFSKFTVYQFKKYASRDSAVTLRDVMFLTHPKQWCRGVNACPATRAAIANKTLPPADTWEVALSAGGDKCEVFTRLLHEGGLGYLALLRNLRNMTEAGVDMSLIRAALIARKGASRVLPFRYVAAARACPVLEPEIDIALRESIGDLPRLPGHTIVLVDVSGSMDVNLSGKSDLTRMDAAAALASIINAESLQVFSFSNNLQEVPPRRGMAGVDVVKHSQAHGGTYLGQSLQHINQRPHDRLIVITDEQSNDAVPGPVAKNAYMVNVASYQNGVGYGRWTHIDGFSENVIRFISETEAADGEA
jgi:hypothetical protein